MVSKKDIRKHILEIRNQMNDKEWEENSHKIYERVISHPFFLHSELIYCYLDHNKEVGTKEIIKYAWKQGKQVAVPKVEGNDMHFYIIYDFSETSVGYRNILEPTSLEKADGKTGVVIMPGVAFDKEKNRIGFGKGYYDRYLSKKDNLKTIAIAFEKQIVQKIPSESFDFCPDILLTEEKCYV